MVLCPFASGDPLGKHIDKLFKETFNDYYQYFENILLTYKENVATENETALVTHRYTTDVQTMKKYFALKRKDVTKNFSPT